MLALSAALDLLRRVEVSELDELTDDAAAVALASVRDLERRARSWRRRLEARG